MAAVMADESLTAEERSEMLRRIQDECKAGLMAVLAEDAKMAPLVVQFASDEQAAEQKEAAREQFALTLEQAKKLAEQGRLPRPMTGRMFASLAERLDLEAEFQELREMQSRRGR